MRRSSESLRRVSRKRSRLAAKSEYAVPGESGLGVPAALYWFVDEGMAHASGSAT